MIYAAVPSLGFGIGGLSYSNFLASAVRSGLSSSRPFQNIDRPVPGPFLMELLWGSKVFGICLCSMKQVDRDKAVRGLYPFLI